MSVLPLMLYLIILIQKCIAKMTIYPSITLIKNLKKSNVRELFTSGTLSFTNIYSYSLDCKFGRIAFLSSSTFIFIHIQSAPILSNKYTIYAADTSPAISTSLPDSTTPLTGGNYVNFLYVNNNKIFAFHSTNLLSVFSYSGTFSLAHTSSSNYFGSALLTDYEVVDSVLLTGTTAYVGVMVYELV
jgi:hypothetical protein